MTDHTPDSIPLKHCPGCGQDKPATTAYFSVQKSTKSGLRSHCKVCTKARSDPERKAEYDREYRAKNKDRIRAQKRRDYQVNRVKIREKQNRRRVENRDAINQRKRAKFRERYHGDPEFRSVHIATGRAWRIAHPEKWRDYYERKAEIIKDRVQRWYVDNREKANERSRRWRLDNLDYARELGRAKGLRRRALKRNAQGTHSTADIRRQYEAQKGKCYYCQVKVGKTYHVDHVIPLSRGGSNGPENIVIACASCNFSKRNKLPHEWGRGNRLL